MTASPDRDAGKSRSWFISLCDLDRQIVTADAITRRVCFGEQHACKARWYHHE
jgi:hypothetical protein